jgi:hypothetical protein
LAAALATWAISQVWHPPQAALGIVGALILAVSGVLLAPQLIGNEGLAELERLTQKTATLVLGRVLPLRNTVVLGPTAGAAPVSWSLLYALLGGGMAWTVVTMFRLGLFAIRLLLGRSQFTDQTLSAAFLAWPFWQLLVLGVYMLLASFTCISWELHSRPWWAQTLVALSGALGPAVAFFLVILPGHCLIGLANLLVGFPARRLSRLIEWARQSLQQNGIVTTLMTPIGGVAFVVGTTLSILGLWPVPVASP